MADINIGETAATTLRNRSAKLADNVLNHNALCARLLRKGNVKPVSGGREIIQELEYAENGTAGWYSGYEVLDRIMSLCGENRIRKLCELLGTLYETISSQARKGRFNDYSERKYAQVSGSAQPQKWVMI